MTVTDWVLLRASFSCGAFTLGGSLDRGEVVDGIDGFRAGMLGNFCGGWTASAITGTG